MTEGSQTQPREVWNGVCVCVSEEWLDGTLSYTLLQLWCNQREEGVDEWRDE